MLHRDLMMQLEQWSTAAHRRPLILRGARQVGKSYLIKEFAKTHFDNFVELNFEFEPELKGVFTSLKPEDIIRTIVLTKGKRIEPGRTLLFLDEIQECPEAISSLRYFFEQLPSLHVIAAGSLLEFILNSENFRMPVGRVQYLHMFPLSFGEFLNGRGLTELREFITALTLKTTIPEVVHNKLIEELRLYLICGGMPAVVESFLAEPSGRGFQEIQLLLLQTYRDDFGKYASQAKQSHLEKVFYSTPRLVGEKLKYSAIDPEVKSRDLKAALLLLEKAGVIRRIIRTTTQGLPLRANANERHIKLNFLDVGLMQRSLGLDATLIRSEDFVAINSGQVAEQLVGQELLACQSPFEDPLLFFWSRDKRGSSAEVDFLISHKDKVIPIEVKAGSTGRLKSLRMLLDKTNGAVGVRLSQLPLSFFQNILSVPIYAIEALSNLLAEINSE